MSDCKYQGCQHHTDHTRYRLRPLLCRLSIHRHWRAADTSPPPWRNRCLLCGYAWVRTLNSRIPERQRWAWWWGTPWFIFSPLHWLSTQAYQHPWIRVHALLENR